MNYTTSKVTTYGMNTESTYDWVATQWTVPLNFFVSQLLKFGDQPVSLQAGVCRYIERPVNGPDWGVFLQAMFLFPK